MDLVENHGNFVFATDKIARMLKIMMIDENDPENDDETLKVWHTDQIKGEVKLLKFVPEQDQLVVISVEPYAIHTFKVMQTSSDTFDVTQGFCEEIAF